MANILPQAETQFVDGNGKPYAGGFVYFYIPNTTTPKNTWQDAAQTILNTNPIVLSGEGRAIIFGSGAYRQQLYDVNMNLVWDQLTYSPVGASDLSDTGVPGGAGLIGFDGNTVAQQFQNRVDRVCKTIAELRTLVKTTYSHAFVEGYYAQGDGGGGAYWYDSSDTTSPDNGGSIIVAADGGRWKLADTTRLSVFQFGAKGNKLTDDTAAIQNCYNAVTVGGTMYIPRAPGDAYIVSSTGGYCLNFSRFVNIKADGFYSSLQPAAGTTVNTVLLKPDPSVAYYGMEWDGLSLGDTNTGNRAGNNGIFIDTTVAGSNLNCAVFRRMNIGQSSLTGSAILHVNTSANNVNGGIYGCIIEDCPALKGGVNLQNSGDSNHIERNVISGNGIGVYASLTAGASELTIIGNNITTNGGQIVIDAGARFHILNNNLEQQVATTGSTVMVNIQGANGTIVNGEIRGNHIGAFTGSNMTANINLGVNAVGTTIDGNTMLNSNVSFVGPGIVDAGTQTRIGFNQYSTTFTSFVTPGTGCMGIRRTLTPINGWSGYSGSVVTVYKDFSGIVHLDGIVTGGTTTANTTIVTMPDSNYYPKQLQRFAVASNNGSSAVHGEVQIDTSGVVSIQAGGNPYFSLSLTFPAANAGAVLSNL